MQYSAVLLEQKSKFFQNEDIYLTFAIYDSYGDLVTDFTDFTFEAELGVSDSQLLESSDCVAESGGLLSIHIPKANTNDMSALESHYLTLKATIGTNSYFLGRFEYEIKDNDLL